MIQPSEFRLGNLVCDKVSGEWMRVTDIGENVGAYLLNRDKYPLPDGWQMAPIELTPEILEKAGGSRIKGDFTGTWSWLFECAGKRVWIKEHGKQYLYPAWSHHIPVESLHQLQNLYFSLCGEELTIQS